MSKCKHKKFIKTLSQKKKDGMFLLTVKCAGCDTTGAVELSNRSVMEIVYADLQDDIKLQFGAS